MTNEDFQQSLTWLDEASGGNAASLGRLLDRYQGRLLARIRWMMGPKARVVAESGDFVQGVFLEALRDPRRLEILGERSLLTWLTAIARNNIRDEVRRQREQVFTALSDSVSQPPASDAPPRRVLEQEQAEFLAEALEKLREEDRRCIELRELEGLSYREVGNLTGRSEEAARKACTRALVRLGRLLGADRQG